MKIGINAHLLSPDDTYRATGVSNYTEHLLRGLSDVDAHNRYRVFAGAWARDVQKRRFYGLGRNFRWEASGLPTQRAPVRIAWEQMLWPLRSARLDVTHGAVNVVPLWGFSRHTARVVTIHDLVFMVFHDKHSPVQRRYLEAITRASVKRADRVIAVSEHTRQDVLRLLGADPKKVITVPEAAGTEFEPRPKAEVEEFRARRGLPERYFFYLGTLEPRKNVPALLRGYARLRATQPDAPILVVAGPKGWQYEEIFGLVRELGLENSVLFPGFVPRDELVLWFNAAVCFVYLSEYEGFGLPPLQAMACGVPAIVHNASSLPEVVGDAGLIVNASEESEVAAALQRFADDERERQEWGIKALARAREFSWRRCAQETLRVYEAAHAAKK